MKKLTLNCKFSSGTSPVSFYIGDSAQDRHPIDFQSKWLAKNYGGKVPEEIMDSLRNLKEISQRNRVSFEELCEYVFEEVSANKEIMEERNFSKEQIEYVAQNAKG